MTRPRLDLVKDELNNLDAEIERMCQDLDSSDSDDIIHLNSIKPAKTVIKSNKLPTTKHGKADKDSLITESAPAFQQRTKIHQAKQKIIQNQNQNSNETEGSPYIKFNRKLPKRKYKPLKDRILDSEIRKEQHVKILKEEDEKKFHEEYPFSPQISKKSSNIRYDPIHLYELPKRITQPPPSPPRVIDPKSERLAEQQEAKTKVDFLQRQFKKNSRTSQISSPPKKIISHQEEQKMIERLSHQKQAYNEGSYEKKISQTQKPKKSDPKVLERLIVQSMQRTKNINNIPQPDQTYHPLINAKSKKMTEGISTDLYQESLNAQERARQRAEEAKRWKEISEKAEYEASQYKPKRKPPILTQSKRKVAGMDEFVERMKKKTRIQEEDLNNQDTINSTSIPRVIAVHPFSFENRPKLTQKS